MALVAVLMLAMLTVGTLCKPVPGDWDHKIDMGQDSDEVQQTENQYTHHEQNKDFEDFGQNQNEQQDIEQVGHQHQDTQHGQNQEFEDFEQNQNEQQDIEQVGHQHQDTQHGQNQEFEDIEPVGHQHQDTQHGQNQEFEDFEQNQNEQQDIEQVGHQHQDTQHGQNQEFEDFEQNQNEQQDHNHVEHVVSKQRYGELGFEFVSTEKPSWWKRLGNNISNTYEKAKDKAHGIANTIKERIG